MFCNGEALARVFGYFMGIVGASILVALILVVVAAYGVLAW